MRKQGCPESSLKRTSRRLRMLSKECNLDNPEDVKDCIARRNGSNGYTNNLVKAYGYYAKVNGLIWEKPRYKRTKRLPKVPSRDGVNRIIARASWKYATVFSVLRDTRMMPEELHRTALRDVDLERGLINAPGFRGHEPRSLKLKLLTVVMLRRYLVGNTEEYPFPKSRQSYEAWRRCRNDLAEKLEDTALKTIRLYDLRHYFGTITYHKTKDILYTKQKMGHRKVETTLIYAQLVNFKEDEWTSAIAKTVKEARELIEKGFEYVTEIDGAKLFRKRK